MKNILIVIDMQNGFARRENTEQLARSIAELIEHEIFDSVIATRFLNGNDSIYEKILGWNRLKTPEDQKLCSEIAPHVDFVADKFIYNCVTPSFLQKINQLNGGSAPEKVYLVGADTDCCVLTIATALFERGIRPIVLTSYCASNGGDESHNAGILCMKRLIGRNQLSDIRPRTKEDLLLL